MTRSKLLKFFYWLKDHFFFLIEVLVKLRIGRMEKEKSEEIQSKLNKEGQDDNQST